MLLSHWKRQWRDSYKRQEDLPPGFVLSASEKSFFDQTGEALPFRVTPYYFSLIQKEDEDDPLRRQALPRIEERIALPCEESDPLEDASFSPFPGLIHRYRDRALLLVTGRCALYCRHCFRRYFTGRETPLQPGDKRLSSLLAYLAKQKDIHELILSGGDPLSLYDGPLVKLLTTIRRTLPTIVLRLATRMPVVLPSRITPLLARRLRRFAPLWVVTQFNHPREITPQSRKALSRLIDRGLPVINQTVLLAGVNDHITALKELGRALVAERVKPYYLFQGDLAKGTSHLRVSLEKGWRLMHELRQQTSGLALPTYALDLPGGGKIPLTASYYRGMKEGWHHFVNLEGKPCRYPCQ